MKLKQTLKTFDDRSRRGTRRDGACYLGARAVGAYISHDGWSVHLSSVLASGDVYGISGYHRANGM